MPDHSSPRLKISPRLSHHSALTTLANGGLIMPYFVVEGKKVTNPVASMPGIDQISVDVLIRRVKTAQKLGIRAVLLFGIPAHKDLSASGAYAADGIVQRAVRAIKKEIKGMLVITDVCLCEYTSHGHCGIVKSLGKKDTVRHLNDFIHVGQTVDLLAQTAVSHARSGADMVAPSAMMPLQVQAIRAGLDAHGFKNTPIMSYSAKFASAFYGPFRDAAGSAPQFGDRTTYQLNPADTSTAIAVVTADIEQGADIVMVKPALAYLDIIQQVHAKFNVPLAAYNVSAEYSMVKAAAQNGWIDEERLVLETMTALRRAGAGIIISYHACDLAKWGYSC
jgi:porphobilinogen synthase